MNGLHSRAALATDLPALGGLLQRPIALPEPGYGQCLVAEQTPAEGGPPTLLATLRLRPGIGLALPRLWYHVGTTVHAAPELGLFHRQRTLLLGHDHTGASELADIAWVHEGVALEVQAAALRLLVQTAWLLMAREREAYAARLIAELPGPRDSAGQSPFWQGLGRHFFSGDPAAAAAAHGPDWRTHVAALLPRQLLYASFLPAAAQAAIGQVHPRALLLREVLEDAGLRYSHHINLEDGGPVLEAATDEAPGMAAARAWSLADAAPPLGAPNWLLLANGPGAWRALRAPAAVASDRLQIGAAVRQSLGINDTPASEASVWALPLGQA